MQRTRYKLLFYDTEATSNVPQESHIISIGAVMVDASGEAMCNPREFHTFVHTKQAIDPCAESIHNIHSSDLVGHPDFPRAVELFRQWIVQELGDDRLAIGGHNSDKFDGQILFCNFRMHSLNYVQFMRDIRVDFTFDTLSIMHKMFKQQPQRGPKCKATGRKSFKLGDCYETFVGKPLVGAHNALTDARALYEIFISQPVMQMYTIKTLFSKFKTAENYHRDINKTCGIANEFIAEHMKPEPDADIERDPIFDDDHAHSERMCLNCMTFVTYAEHDVCTIPRTRK